jgi:cell division protein ZipA
LAGLGVLLLAGIWWWGARRSRQAPGNAGLREPVIPKPAPVRATEDAGMTEHTAFDQDPAPRDRDPAARTWGVPPFEPLSIRTAEFDEPPAVEPMSSRAQPFKSEPFHAEPWADASAATVADARAAPSEPWPAMAEAAVPALPSEPWPAMPEAEVPALPSEPWPAMPEAEAPAPIAPPAANAGAVADPAELQHIVSIRVCAPTDTQWAGIDLLAALENHGMAHGRYSVFHRKHSDGRTQFCAASLVEPGTFSLASMPHQEFRGLTLFAVLPGPVEPLQTLDALIETAGALAQTLDGTLQDSDGLPLTVQRAEALRAQVARLQSLPPMN